MSTAYDRLHLKAKWFTHFEFPSYCQLSLFRIEAILSAKLISGLKFMKAVTPLIISQSTLIFFC